MTKRFYFLLFVFISVFFSCSRYYYSTDARKFLLADSLLEDTLTINRIVNAGGKKMWFIDQAYKKGDTIFYNSALSDSTFFDISMYILDSTGLHLYSEFYAYSLNLLFFAIKKDMVFSLNPHRVGYMHIVKELDAPDFYQKVKLRSFRSQLDTVIFNDTILQVLRVDVRNKMIFRDKKENKKTRVRQILHFYYYPGFGQIMVRGKGYEEHVLGLFKQF